MKKTKIFYLLLISTLLFINAKPTDIQDGVYDTAPLIGEPKSSEVIIERGVFPTKMPPTTTTTTIYTAPTTTTTTNTTTTIYTAPTTTTTIVLRYEIPPTTTTTIYIAPAVVVTTTTTIPPIPVTITEPILTDADLATTINIEKPIYYFSKIPKIAGNIPFSKEVVDNIFFRGYTKLKENKHQESIRDFNEILNFEYRAEEAAYYMGLNYYLMRNYSEAKKFMSVAIEGALQCNVSNQKMASLYYTLGYIHYYNTEYTDAIVYFEKSLQYDKNYIKNYNLLGASYYKLGEVDKALGIWDIGVKLGNSDSIFNRRMFESK